MANGTHICPHCGCDEIELEGEGLPQVVSCPMCWSPLKLREEGGEIVVTVALWDSSDGETYARYTNDGYPIILISQGSNEVLLTPDDLADWDSDDGETFARSAIEGSPIILISRGSSEVRLTPEDLAEIANAMV